MSLEKAIKNFGEQFVSIPVKNVRYWHELEMYIGEVIVGDKAHPKRSSIAFEFKDDIGNVMQLWHGTKASNLLSIFRQGLVIPPSSSSHCTGRMYGDGLYFSCVSTKALNYATNFWGGGGSTNRTFMFLAEVAMGNPYIAGGGWGSYPKSGYDSTWAKGGQSGVINDEMIVYKLNQANLVYLVEFE